MGHSESVMVQERLARFRPDEGDLVEGMFDHLLRDGVNSAGDPKEKAAEVLTFDTLKSSMGIIASESMIKRVYRSMCSVDPGMPSSPTTSTRTETAIGTVPGVHREQLIIFIADVLVGTAEERAPLVMAMTQQGSKLASCEQVAEFLQELVSAVVQILVHRGRLQGWKTERMGDCSLGVKLLVEQMCSELKPSDKRSCDVACLEDWISRVSQVAVYLEMLVVEGLDLGLTSRPTPTLLPLCRETHWNNLHCMLDLPTLMLLASKIPDSYSAPWRLLYSTQLHGESFSRIMGNCTKHGPTLLIIKDTKGHVFGGYASHAWEVKPQFQGDSSCFLFTVFPSLRVYTCTGYNQNYMYLNHDQQTMPNGLGMGGQHGYFGLWLDSDFGRGHSRAKPKCTTYGSPQLSGEEEFTLDSMEVWGVGKPIDCDDENKRSVLKVDPELQAMMEITGKTLHSQGLRELEEDDDSVCSK